jgi:hypothetical protein
VPEPAHDVVIETSKERPPGSATSRSYSIKATSPVAVSAPVVLPQPTPAKQCRRRWWFKASKRSSSSASVRAASQPLFVHRYWPTGSAYSRDGACTALRMAFVMLRSDCGLPVNNWLINSVSCGGIRLNPVADSR